MKSLFVLFILLLISATGLNASDRYPISPTTNIIHYRFTIILSDKSDTIKANAEIEVAYSGDTKTTQLDLKSVNEKGLGMIVEGIFIDDAEAEWSHTSDRIVINHTEAKMSGDTSSIIIKYHGVPADGMIISSNRHGSRTFFADNWPDRARNWIPCVDHPSDKATVEFIVYSPAHYSVVSNGYLFEESLLPGDLKLTHWKEETEISTKVMVIGVARFARQLAGIVDGTEIWSWIFPEDREKGFLDYSVALEPFAFFSENIGKYAYEKLANVQSKTIFGGMENAGCIFYSERSVSGREGAEGLIAHEIAHQWFGNSVTERDWHHVWLSEGFATYFTAFYMEDKYGESKMKADMQRSRTRVISAYKNSPAPLVDTTITNFMNLLSTNSYQKGSWVLHMLRNEIGDSLFIEGIRSYFSIYFNTTALSSDFRRVMEEVSGFDLADFFEQWLYRPGMPELSVSWKYNSREKELTVKIEQTQKGDPYNFPLDLDIVSEGRSIRERVDIYDKVNSFTFQNIESIISVETDPEVKLLFINSGA